METQTNSILIHESDDVATAIVELCRGERARFWRRGEIEEIEIAETIPQYHKFALRPIRQKDAIRKYGEVIGTASCDISMGAHVHVHNVESSGGQGA